MTSEFHDSETLIRLFEAAIDLPENQRELFLERHTLSAGSRERLRELLAHFDSDTTLMPENAGSQRSAMLQERLDQQLIGKTLGSYAILEKIGEGGMGSVFLAKRADDAFDKRVAIKLMANRLGTDSATEQFRQERQILAHLQHPYIARLLDGGTTDQGWAYLVMDYVEGEPIHSYCKTNQLDLRQRIHMILKLCTAVQYAHQNMVIHGDIKPANILVNASGDPILMDFGIAQLVPHPHASSTGRVQPLETLRFSPQYASPEQIFGQAVSAASDVYSLGILLHQLLTDRLPYELPRASLQDMRAFLKTLAIAKPSALVSGSKAEKSQKQDPIPWRPLKGDLDSILLKTLAKDPQDRYPTAALLKADLQRYLNGYAPLARNSSPWLSFAKWVKRNPLFTIAMAGLTLGLGYHFLAMERKSQRILQENQRFKQAFVLMRDMLAVEADSAPTDSDPLTIAELLRIKAQKAMDFEIPDPALKREYWLSMAESLFAVGMVAEASQAVTTSARLCQTECDRKSADHARCLFMQGALAYFEGNHELADEPLQEAARLYQRHDHALALADTWILQGKCYRAQGMRAQALPLFHQALALRQKNLPATSRKIASALYELGYTQRLLGEVTAARTHQEEALQVHNAQPPAVTPLAIRIRRELFECQLKEGRLAEAESHLKAATDMTQRLYGYHHKDVAMNLKSLGSLQVDRGHFDAAILSYFESEELHRTMLGEKHLSLAGIQHNLGEAYRLAQDWEQAEAHYRKAVAINTEGRQGKPNLNLGFHLLRLGATLIRRGNLAEAEAVLCQANEMFLAHSSDPSRESSLVKAYLAEIYLEQGHVQGAKDAAASAEPFLEQRDHLELALVRKILTR